MASKTWVLAWESAFSRGRRTPTAKKAFSLRTAVFGREKKRIIRLSCNHMTKSVAKKRGRGRPRKVMKKQPEKPRGKASSLPGELWPRWLAHVHKNGTCWLHACLLLTHVLCLRVTEALSLKASDFNWRGRYVHVAGLKKQQATNKPLLTVILPVLRLLRDKGISCKRTKKRGVRGSVSFRDTWSWPADGESLLFPAGRKDSKLQRRSKNTVCKAVQRLRKTFQLPKSAWVDVAKIRSHTGRHRMVNDLKIAGVPDEVAMLYARISDSRLGTETNECLASAIALCLEPCFP